MEHSPIVATFNPPSPVTSFIGREVEIELALRLLTTTRLLTLTGPGGSGKTRLALVIAEAVGNKFRDGVAFASLAPISDPTLVASTIVTTLGIATSPDQPPIENLKRFLASQQMLLVLDNFEQVVVATSLVSDLQRTCPQLTVLVTSRISLHLSGEQELPVSPLPLPPVGNIPGLAELGRNPAVSLFVRRAQWINPTFQLTESNAAHVVDICRMVEGLPLAIELAAARTRLLTPHGLVQRLDRRLPLLTDSPRDVPERQQTIQDTIAWSYDLLPSDAQQLFRQLSIFVDGWTLEAAEAVCDVGSDILNGLATLVDHNLVHRVDQADGSVRFAILETIREFGLAQLGLCHENDTARRQHAEYFASLAAWFERRRVVGATVTSVYGWYNQVTAEQNNMRSALAWALDHEPDSALRIAAGLGGFWFYHDDWDEGRRWLRAALDLNTTPAHSRERALTGAASLATWQGDFEEGQGLHDEALELARGLDDWDGIARACHGLGRIAHHQGEVSRAIALYEESLTCYEYIPVDGFVTAVNKAATLGNLGELLLAEGQLQRASELLTEAVAFAECMKRARSCSST